MSPLDDPLSPEDALRLNVLLSGEVHAVRIDEGARVLNALTPRGEARIPLNPVGRAERYFQRVRELLGGHALDSPGGYPVHLRRWTRMGHAEPQRLAALLKLGEPDAVLAVAYAPTLDDELARRVWWAGQNGPLREIAQVMLARPAVRAGAMGPVLVDYLVEHLPFEADPVAAMNIVRAVLASGLASAPARASLWAKGKRRPHYLIGFLEHLPDELPDEGVAGVPPEGLPDGPAGRLLAQCRCAAGITWLATAELALEKPPTHEAIYLLLDLIGRRFAAGRGAPGALTAWPTEAAALEALAQVSGALAEPVLTRTTAVGPLLRRHLEPLLGPILDHLRILRGAT